MMVPMTDLAARAADPNTSHSELYQLANDHPELRPQIAENPNTYPDLVAWLGSLGDPQIDAALRRRGQATQAMPTLPQDQATEAFSAVGEPDYGDTQYPADQDAEQEQDAAYYPAAPVYPSPAAAGYPDAPAYQQPQPWPGYAEEPPARRRGGAGCVLLALLGFLLLSGLTAAFFLLPLTLFGNDDEPQDEVIEEEAPEEAPAEEPSPTPEDTEAPAQEEEDEPEEDEEDFERPAPDDALDVESFSAPSDNIHCEMTEDEVTCTINEYSFDAPSGCSEAVTLTVSQDGDAQTDCGTTISSQAVSLNYGQTTSNGDFACTSGEDGFECWSTRSGNGFFMAREDFELTN